jgi:Cu(I)/Ag(I) efflux system membrane fusion protein
MKRAGRIGLTLAALLAAGAAGYWAGLRGFELPPVPWSQSIAWLRSIPWLQSLPWVGPSTTVPASPKPAPTGPVIYYRDPDGRPYYSAEPRKTADGRDFLPVLPSEDISFDPQAAGAEPPVPPGGASAACDPAKILYYRNPMGLPDTSPVPKKDSMGMDYIPVHACEDEGAGIVKIAPGKLQRTGVRSEVVAERVIPRQLRAPGSVEPDERRVSVVSVPTDGFVGRVENVTTGDHVRKGQPLLQLRSHEIAVAAGQLLLSPGYDGTHRRLENLNVPPELIAEIERTRQVPLAFTWPSPRDGIVLVRNATEGMKVSGGDVLFRIADLSIVWVLTDVPEYELAGVEVGQIATIRLRSLPGHSFEGRVVSIYPQVDKETRTTKVRIELPNPELLLRADMYADVEIAVGAPKPVVAVPDSAVIDTGTRQVVILDKGEGRFEPRKVKTGARGGGYVEIRRGVAPGDRVVVAANFLIDAESNLKAALAGMAAEDASQ